MPVPMYQRTVNDVVERLVQHPLAKHVVSPVNRAVNNVVHAVGFNNRDLMAVKFVSLILFMRRYREYANTATAGVEPNRRPQGSLVAQCADRQHREKATSQKAAPTRLCHQGYYTAKATPPKMRKHQSQRSPPLVPHPLAAHGAACLGIQQREP